MNEDTRERLIAQFKAYLDAAEATPAIARSAEREVDLFTVFGELAALKNEVKLESRQVKTALSELGAVFDALRADNRLLREQLQQRSVADREQEKSLRREVLLELLELRDRLAAGAASARGHRAGLLGRLRGGEHGFILALGAGMEMSIKRLDEMLERHGVTAMLALAQAFDPLWMRAVGHEHCDDRPEGVVLAELRKGFLQGEEVLRAAEVVVNKRKQAHE